MKFVGAAKEMQLALIEGIAAEEDRTRLYDEGDVGYSMLAKSMRNRLRNIEQTIERLENELTRLRPQLDQYSTKLVPDLTDDHLDNQSR